MGHPMAQHLVNAGYTVTVYNRSKDKETGFGNTASSPRETMAASGIVFLMVSDDAAIHDLVQGPEGLLAAGVSGKLVINMSTVSPHISREVAVSLHKQGNEYLDAPVSGSVKQAQDAALVFTALDANKDGKVTKAEAQKNPMVAQMFDQADKNKDGSLSKDEFAAAFGK